MTARARKRTSPAKRRPRRNAPLELSPRDAVRSGGGVLMSRNVLELLYEHAQSAGTQPYKHDFGGGVRMYAMPDGSITLRHPQRRLWEDRIVPDDA
jgi:hypothetical protein